MRRYRGSWFFPALPLVGAACGAMLVLAGCTDSVEDAGCDLFLGSASVRGIVRDFDNLAVPNVDVEFTISDTSSCVPDFTRVLARGETDANGYYEVLVQSGNTVGTRCIFGRVARSDSISAGLVEFTSDCRRKDPMDEVELDLFATASALIPEDLKITLYREPPFFNGPVYEVAVDATGYVEYEGIQNVAVEGAADSTVELTTVARLYRAFEEIGYWYIKTIYDPDECHGYSWDADGAATSLTAGGRTHTVIHNHGCHGISVLDSLTHLECRIDSVLGTYRWTGKWPGPCEQ